MTRDTYDLFQTKDRGRFGDDVAGVDGESDSFTALMFFHHDTSAANLVSEAGEERHAVWLPKSKATVRRTGKSGQGHKANGQSVMLPMVNVSMPEWLAREKGLL